MAENTLPKTLTVTQALHLLTKLLRPHPNRLPV